MKPFLTIVITTFKRNNLLVECLESLFKSIEFYRNNHKQNDLKFEILIFDDNPEQSINFKNEILNNFNSRDALTTLDYKINKANLGDYFNRNQAINDATGTFLKYIDDDDILYETSIDFIVSSIKSFNFEVRTYIFYIRDNFRHLEFPIRLDSSEQIFDFHYLKYGLFHCSLVSVIFPVEHFRDIKGFIFKRFYGDFEILNRIALYSNAVIFPFELGYYRQHDMQESKMNQASMEIRFNYLLISSDFYRMGRFNNKIRKVLIRDNYNYLKGGAKRFNLSLVLKSLKLLYYLKRNCYSNNEVNRWKRYYNSNLVIFDNEIIQ